MTRNGTLVIRSDSGKKIDKHSKATSHLLQEYQGIIFFSINRNLSYNLGDLGD
jgi:hypothetical protein